MRKTALQTSTNREGQGKWPLRVRAMQRPKLLLQGIPSGGTDECLNSQKCDAQPAEAAVSSNMEFGGNVASAGALARMREMKRSPKTRHPLSGVKPTLDLIYILDKGICWLCNKPVERQAASLDHAVPKKLMGSKLRAYDSFANYYLAHKKCNRVRGCPTPPQTVIRWDRLVEEDHAFIRRLFGRMEQFWGPPLGKKVKRFIDGRTDRVPYARRTQ